LSFLLFQTFSEKLEARSFIEVDPAALFEANSNGTTTIKGQHNCPISQTLPENRPPYKPLFWRNARILPRQSRLNGISRPDGGFDRAGFGAKPLAFLPQSARVSPRS
jgi:hypothetical protein